MSFKWVMIILRKSNPKDYTLDEIMKRTEIKIKPKLDLEEFKGKTCTIVGSSPKLLEQELGEEIDSHDYVVRFNLSRTDGYEKHTTVKLISELYQPNHLDI